MNQEEFEQQMIQDMEDLKEDEMDDQLDDQMLAQEEWKEAYGVPEPEEKHNQHTFLARSLDIPSSEKVTFLTESELGRPLFSIRFLLDIEDIAKYYLDDMAKSLGLVNEIAIYFREKITNVCNSGMSNKGFVQNLNVTKKMDATRQRVRDIPPQVKEKRK
jgi:hypothetical protein